MFDRATNFLFGDRGTAFGVGFLIVTAILLTASLWVIQFVFGRTMALSPVEEFQATAGFTAYSVEPTSEYLDPESLVAMAEYSAAFPEPQNVQVLEGMTTAEISGYMVKYMSGGLKVDCTYCHNIADFSSDEVPAKETARQMLIMTADLNQNWLPLLADLTPNKQPSGKQIACATCHLGEPLPEPWPENLVGLPDDYRLPLEDLTVLQVTGRRDVSLDTVQYNQWTMYHFNTSLDVGCTHCHNARYFPSWERPAKFYALTMLQMVQHIDNEYSDIMNNKEPSCTMCHQGNILPPGSATADADLPAVLSRPSASSVPDDTTAERTP